MQNDNENKDAVLASTNTEETTTENPSFGKGIPHNDKGISLSLN